MALLQDKRHLVKAINDRIGKGPYSDWHIGITNKPDDEKDLHRPKRWQQWRAASLRDARDTKSYFTKKGMEGEPVGDIEEGVLIFVYIF